MILNGAAGSLVGIGSAWPSARALARRYISLFVAPLASIAAATTAQFRISVVILIVNRRLLQFRNCSPPLRSGQPSGNRTTEQESVCYGHPMNDEI